MSVRAIYLYGIAKCAFCYHFILKQAKNIYKYLRRLLKMNGFAGKNVRSATISEEMYGCTCYTVEYTGFTADGWEASAGYVYYSDDSKAEGFITIRPKG